MSINGMLNIGRTALQANQTALQVTSHNIANVNTPGYSRQRLVLETTTPIMTGAGAMGTGVRAQEIKRVYDRFLAYQAKGERESFGRLSTEKDSILKVEDIFNEVSGSGIKDRLADFFNSIKDLSNNASGYTERSQVLAKAENLSFTIRNKASDLSTLRKNIDSGVKNKIEDVNAIIKEIAGLNGKVAERELGATTANDLRDKRDGLMAELSNLIAYDSIEDGSGQVTIYVGKGSVMVDSTRYYALTGVPVASNGNLTDIMINNGNGDANITSDISGGELKGLLNVRDSDIPWFQSRLNTLAATLAGQINAQHSLGYGLDGTTSLPFFSVTSGDEASTIAVSVTDTNKIAAAASNPVTTSGPSDNGNALLIAGIQENVIASLGNATMDGYYNSIITDAGIRSRSVSDSFKFQKFTKEQLENRIESVSGVSLDEEAADMMRFQKSFEAAAKLIITADELMQTVLNLKR